MNAFHRSLFAAFLLGMILSGCAGTQANTSQHPAQAAIAQTQSSTSVPF